MRHSERQETKLRDRALCERSFPVRGGPAATCGVRGPSPTTACAAGGRSCAGRAGGAPRRRADAPRPCGSGPRTATRPDAPSWTGWTCAHLYRIAPTARSVHIRSLYSRTLRHRTGRRTERELDDHVVGVRGPAIRERVHQHTGAGRVLGAPLCVLRQARDPLHELQPERVARCRVHEASHSKQHMSLAEAVGRANYYCMSTVFQAHEFCI